MRIAVAALACLLASAGTQAASTVILQKGDGEDQILTMTREDGSVEAALTLICEPPKLAFGVAVLAPGLTGATARIRVRADGETVSIGAPGVRSVQTVFFLKGQSGRAAIDRLTRASVVEIETGAAPHRFRPQDGAGTVAQFRGACGI